MWPAATLAQEHALSLAKRFSHVDARCLPAIRTGASPAAALGSYVSADGETQTINNARKSLTLVKRRPRHHQVAERREEAVGVVAVEELAAPSCPCAAARASVSGVTMAPALSSTPSMPSVSAAEHPDARLALQRDRAAEQELGGSAAASAGRALPAALTVTVVSPPDRITHGCANGAPRRATARASAACTLPTSRDSPSISSLRMCGLDAGRARHARPPLRGFAAASRSGAPRARRSAGRPASAFRTRRSRARRALPPASSMP